MSFESKMKFRIYACLVAGFVLLVFIVGLLYALSIALLAFLLWKAYLYAKLMHWWKGESPITHQIIEFIAERLNDGPNSKSLWVKSLASPETAELARNYRVELMARPMIIEKQSPSLIEGWTEWGATRLEECVLRLDAKELAENMGSETNPIPMGRIMVSKAALEITVAEHALALLGIPNSRQVVSQRLVSKHLEARKSELDIAWAAKGEAMASALRLLEKELEE